MGINWGLEVINRYESNVCNTGLRVGVLLLSLVAFALSLQRGQTSLLAKSGKIGCVTCSQQHGVTSTCIMTLNIS